MQEILDPEDKAKRCDLLLDMADALTLTLETKRILDIVAPEAFPLAETYWGRRHVFAGLRGRTFGLISRTRFTQAYATPQAAEWAERANRYAQPDTIERALADAVLGATRWSAGHPRSGHQLITQGVDLARRLGDPEYLMECVDTTLLLFQTAPQYAEQNVQLAEELIEADELA